MKKVIIIPHTHWDREWYFSEKEFKDRLIRVMDNVLEYLEKYKEFTFQFDGQVAPVIDYLSRKKHNEKKIKKFVREGRLFIGPSFVLPDEFLSTGEALVRNLEYGIKLSKKFGKCYKVGYYPDTFGHIGQLPQILKKFGIENFCIWRGVPSLKEKRYIGWFGSDGSYVKGYKFNSEYNVGYGNFCRVVKKEGKLLVYRGGRFVSLEKIIDEEFKAGGDVIVLMNGSDHTDVNEGIVEIVKELNSKYKDIEFKFGSFEEYFELVKEKVPGIVYFGEMNKGTEKTFLLKGTYSTRIPQVKQPYWKCNRKLLNAEFLQTLVEIFGCGHYDDKALDEAWEYLLLNMPHDTICGCSVDKVYKDAENRFNQVEEITEKLIKNSCMIIGEKVDTSFIKERSLALIVFNPSDFTLNNFKTRIELPEDFEDFEIFDSEGKKLEYIVLKRSFKQSMEENAGNNYRLNYKKCRIYEVIIGGNIGPLGYETFEIRKARKRRKNRLFKNESIEVEFNPTGSFNIKDLKNGIEYKNCHIFFDFGDAGDEYNFSPPQNDMYEVPRIGTKVKKVFENGLGKCYKVEYEIKLPKALKKDRKKRVGKFVRCKLNSYITLLKNSRRIDIKTEFENKVRDHILRMAFSTPIKSNYSYASGHFEIVKRPIIKEDNSLEGRVEVSTNTHSLCDLGWKEGDRHCC